MTHSELSGLHIPGISPDSFSSSETPRIPVKNQLEIHSPGRRKTRSPRKKFFKRISFGMFRKWNSSSKEFGFSNEAEGDNRNPEPIAANVKNTKGEEFKQPDHIAVPDQYNSAVHSHRRRRSFRRRLRKIRKWGIFGFWGRKKEIKPVFTPVYDELINPDIIKVSWQDYIRPVLNSTAWFMIAYQVSWLFYQFAVMLAASFYRIDSVLFYYELMFPIGSNSQKWTPGNIIQISLAGPFFCLTVWAFLKLTLHSKIHLGAQLRTFLVWMYLNTMMLFFGAFVGGAITLEGFGYVIDWLFMSTAIRLILSVVFLCIIVWLSWKVVLFLPESSRTDSWKNNRPRFIFSRLIIPWFLGAGIMTLLKIPNAITQHENIFDYDTINLATLLFAVVPPLFNSETRPRLMRKSRLKPGMKKAIPFIVAAAAILVVLLFRFVLSYGLYFNLVMDLNIYLFN